MSKQFSYQAVVKLKTPESQASRIPSVVPGANTMNLESRFFTTYDECAESCVTFMKELSIKANEGLKDPIFKVSTEVNPLISGKSTLSKDWALGEISRVWIYDKEMEKSGKIVAIGQAKIFAFDTPSIQLN